MKRFVIISCILIGSCTTTGVAVSADKPYNYNPDAPLLIRPFGDSITYGYGFASLCNVKGFPQTICMPPLEIGGGYRGWMTVLAFDSNGIEFSTEGFQSGGSNASQWMLNTENHDGYPGWTNKQLITRAELYSFSDITLVHSGTNDILQRVEASDAATYFNMMMDNLMTANTSNVIFIALIIPFAKPPAGYPDFTYLNPGVTEYNNTIQSTWQNNTRVRIVDMQELLNPQTDYADGVHPNMSGYQKMACAWVQAINIQGQKVNGGYFKPGPEPCSEFTSGKSKMEAALTKSDANELILTADQLKKLLKQ